MKKIKIGNCQYLRSWTGQDACFLNYRDVQEKIGLQGFLNFPAERILMLTNTTESTKVYMVIKLDVEVEYLHTHFECGGTKRHAKFCKFNSIHANFYTKNKDGTLTEVDAVFGKGSQHLSFEEYLNSDLRINKILLDQSNLEWMLYRIGSKKSDQYPLEKLSFVDAWQKNLKNQSNEAVA